MKVFFRVNSRLTLPPSNQSRPYWLWQTKRLFPSRVFAFVVGLAGLVVGFLFGGVALNVQGCWPMAIPSVIFFLGAAAIVSSAFVSPNEDDSQHEPANRQSDKPTFAIIVLLIGVYSWLLTLSMHIFRAFFKNGPGSTKYYVTLAIAILATLFMKAYGKRVVSQHFGRQGGRHLEIDGWQAFCVVVLVLSFGFYFTWLMI
jgi:Ca2+/H+ antiporter